MKKPILFISQQFPFPLTDGGNIRTFKILESLAARHEVVLVASLSPGADREESLRAVAGLCSEAHCLPDVKSRTLPAYLRAAARAVLEGLPLAVSWNYNPHIRREAERLLATRAFHAVHLNHLDTLQYLPDAGAPPAVLDTHNLLWRFWEKAAETAASPLRRILARVEAARMRAYEGKAFRRVGTVLVCSRPEADLLAAEGIPAAKVHVVPNGVDCAYFHPPAAGYAGNPPTVVFTGAMGYPPNAEAALRFVREVMPHLRREVPGARFLAVGKDPGPELLEAAKGNPDVTVTGKVPDVRSFVWGSRVFAVPIRLGAGTRLKVLEAFSMGIPAVSTAIGAEGIDWTDGEDIVIADRPEAMAAAIAGLIRDPARAAAQAEKALRLARERYDWRAVGRALAEAYGGAGAPAAATAAGAGKGAP